MSQKAVIYARFSPRPNAADCLSIEKQDDRCRKYCEVRDWSVAAMFSDTAVSGKSTDGREYLEFAIKEAVRLKCPLVALDLSRIARSTVDAIKIVERLEKNGAQLVLVNQQIDTTTPIGKFFFTIVAAFGELERATISQRTSEAMLYHQSQGRPMGGVPPFGLRVCDEQLIEDQGEKEVIRVVLQMRNSGESFRQIALSLDCNGYKCRGSKWHASTVRRIWERYGAGL